MEFRKNVTDLIEDIVFLLMCEFGSIDRIRSRYAETHKNVARIVDSADDIDT